MADHHRLPFDLRAWPLPEIARSESYGETERLRRIWKGRRRRRGKTEGERDGGSLQAVRMTELVHQSLATFRLLHDALLVVLSDAAAELVVIHGGSVLPLAPESRHAHRVLDLENPLAAVQPTYAGAVHPRTLQQFLQELPEMNVAAAVAHLPAVGAIATLTGSAFLVLVCTQSMNGRCRERKASEIAHGDLEN